MGVEVAFGGRPVVLSATEDGLINGTGELRVSSGELEAHSVAVLLVLIDKHDGPLAVGPMVGIGGDESVAGAISDVGGGGVELVCAFGLEPFVVDELRNEELRERLVDGVVGMNGKHPEGSGGVVASMLELQRKVVEIVNAAAAITEERTDVIREPEATEDVFVGF